MKARSIRNKFVFYRYTLGENKLVAIASEYLPKIKHALQTFGSFKDIPSDWEVRGIFLQPEDKQTMNLDAYAQQSEIILNCLEIYEESRNLS